MNQREARDKWIEDVWHKCYWTIGEARAGAEIGFDAGYSAAMRARRSNKRKKNVVKPLCKNHHQ